MEYKSFDYNIMHTPYKKDVVKLIADECHEAGLTVLIIIL